MAKYIKHNGLTLSKGNAKLADTIGIFNLPAVKTCPNCSKCAKSCYALKAERLYPSVKACREANLEATKLPTFVGDMVQLITKAKVMVVRIHESGDYYSQTYADSWSAIAALLPHVRFYCYTKSPYRPTGSNINIVESILPDGSINYGTESEMLPKAQSLGAFICPCKPNDRSKLCGTTCTVCQSAKHVLFIKH